MCAVGYREVNEVARAIDADVTVVSLEPTSVEGVLNSISTVGAMTDAEESAVDVVADLRERLQKLETRLAQRRERASHRFAWSAWSGSTRRSRLVTGSPSRSAGRAAGTCWGARANGRSGPRGTRSVRSTRRCSC